MPRPVDTPCTCPNCGGATHTGWIADLGQCYDCQRIADHPGLLPVAHHDDPWAALARALAR